MRTNIDINEFSTVYPMSSLSSSDPMASPDPSLKYLLDIDGEREEISYWTYYCHVYYSQLCDYYVKINDNSCPSNYKVVYRDNYWYNRTMNLGEENKIELKEKKKKMKFLNFLKEIVEWLWDGWCRIWPAWVCIIIIILILLKLQVI